MNHGYYAPPPPPAPKKGLGVFAVLAIVFGSLFGGCLVLGAVGRAVSSRAADAPAVASSGATAAPTDREPVAKAAPPPPAKPEPAIAVEARELFAAYHANEVAADDRYKGKLLAVHGTVDRIEKDFTGDIVLRLATANQFVPVDAKLRPEDKAEAAQLAHGNEVRLLCRGQGMVIGRPQLAKCAVE